LGRAILAREGFSGVFLCAIRGFARDVLSLSVVFVARGLRPQNLQNIGSRQGAKSAKRSHFIRQLRNGVITASELGAYVSPIVAKFANQTPAVGNLVGSEGGEFVFELQPSC
jgi:hypothetical protein